MKNTLRARKTFLTSVTMLNDVLDVELTLVDSHYKTALVDSIDEILSMTVVYNDCDTYTEESIIVVKPLTQSDKIVSFSAKIPSQGVESVFINTLDKSIQIEL
jgi:hypothetical protein